MPMMYQFSAIRESEIPVAAFPVFQHLLDTYAAEINKTVSIWRRFAPEDLSYRPRKRSRTALEIMIHQLNYERRFFAEFLCLPEPDPSELIPAQRTMGSFSDRMHELSTARLNLLAVKDEGWWLQKTPFFDVERQRIWTFWRSVLHNAHHRAQLAVYLRLLNKPVPPVYGPTADPIWIGADPGDTEDRTYRA